MRLGVVLTMLGAMGAATVQAAEPRVEGAVYRERAAGGERTIEPAEQLQSGDRVVLLVRWQAADDRDGFTVTTPVPRALTYQRGSSDALEVSLDGGRSWTRRSALPGARSGRVTHLRWKVSPRQAALGSGSFAYSALVR